MAVLQVYKNYVAAFLWCFAAVWVTMLCLMTYVLIRDGIPPGQSPVFMVSVVIVFWIAGIGLIRYVAQKPCTTVKIESHGIVVITLRYPHRVIRQSYPCSAIANARVIETEDSDGDPYFLCQITAYFPFTEPITLVEGTKDYCEEACASFNAAVRSLS